MRKYTVKRPHPGAEGLAKALSISPLTAQVLINRGVRSVPDGKNFMFPGDGVFGDIAQMKGVPEAASTIASAIESGKKIALYGDYDVDGVMSLTIMHKALATLGARLTYYIPHRELEGYGLNEAAVMKIAETSDVLITCDNGIASSALIELAARNGLTVVVIDHHECLTDGETVLVPAHATVIDPKQPGCAYPFKLMCAAALCYRFVKHLFTVMDKPFTSDNEYIMYAAIATVCDVVPLISENRAIVKKGLEIINSVQNTSTGLISLIEAKSLAEKEITVFDLGFIIGPCINAAGRMVRATLALRMFLTDNIAEATETAQLLISANDDRKYLTDRGLEAALASIGDASAYKVLVCFDESIEGSVAGIVAGRLKEMFYRPVIVLTLSDGHLKGSARSIPGYHLVRELSKASDILIKYGGHEAAAGLSVPPGGDVALRSRLNETCTLTDEQLIEAVSLDARAALPDITYTLATELRELGPFGNSNPEPIFGTKGALLCDIRIIDAKNTVIMTFDANGRKIKGVMFGAAADVRQTLIDRYGARDGEKIAAGILRGHSVYADIIYTVSINEYNGSVSVQLKIKDFSISQ